MHMEASSPALPALRSRRLTRSTAQGREPSVQVCRGWLDCRHLTLQTFMCCDYDHAAAPSTDLRWHHFAQDAMDVDEKTQLAANILVSDLAAGAPSGNAIGCWLLRLDPNWLTLGYYKAVSHLMRLQ